MPDLTVHTARWCLSNEYDEVRVGDYQVIFNRGKWSCTCKGFKFRKKCRHTLDADAQRCRHGWEAAAGSPVEMGEECPECKGPTRVMEFAA